MRFTKGALGSAAVSGATMVFEQGIYIHGTKGSVKCSIYGGSMDVWVGKNKIKYPAVAETSSLQQNFIAIATAGALGRTLVRERERHGHEQRDRHYLFVAASHGTHR
jgi:hypothetical protein